ncbi:BRO1-domain-containing protein [Tilletiaria anomala UBC 951]|uniref:BRO domain-containing protein 1 n=1 Tax=Tilletiaria anomala (strain ATCC 24038 / CBS 436.72 / UBC 951) TaxID=1037660 RepID=A0A066WGV5_TILAU|nr:BRO1-domain-containing protein [Tilletiaria anomala UBC 951]KDN49935.1 BRO1-domain-containing protein [Tilletiaria anomala UBC 951]
MSAASVQSPMMWFPPKATEGVDLATPVKSLIQNSYGEQPSNFADQLSTLNRTRQDALQGAGSDATVRDLLFKWFHMLEMLELRFSELRVQFPWKDAFTSKSISQYSLAYEKACVIFNIAATLSSFASSQVRLAGNPDGIKRSYTSYRQAAGMLSHINDNFLHAPSTDMSKEVIKCLTTIMLAQASEVFWEKTVEEKKGCSLIAKIASHVATTYHQSIEDMKAWVNRGVFDRQWLSMISTKERYFSSVTQYYRALADESSSQLGACIVRLTIAEREAKEAVALASAFHSSASGYLASKHLPADATTSLTTIVKTHLAVCTERKALAVKDNDLIYHDILPSESALPPVDKLVAATPMTIQEVFATPEVEKVVSPDLFQRLVPLQVHESASMYSEEKAKLARAESERHDLANGELEAALEYMGLPASLQIFKNVGTAGASGLDSLADPPAEVVHWSEELARGASASLGQTAAEDSIGNGDSEGVDSAFGRLEQMRAKAAHEIASVFALLDDENRECEKARVRWGHEWTQEPSGLQTRAVRADLKGNRDALAAACANDERIRDLWNNTKGDVQLLARGRPALEQAFAEAVSSSAAGCVKSGGASLLDLNEEEDSLDDRQANAMKTLVTDIDALVLKLNKIKRERASTLHDMKEKIQEDDISQILVLNRRNANIAPTIFAQELEKFKAYQSRIALCNDQQQQVIVEVTQKWKQLTEGKEAKEMQKRYAQAEAARRRLVERLRQSRDSSVEVRGAVLKGLAFYSDLLDIVGALRHNAEIFVAERKSERERLVSEREWDDKLKPGGDDGQALSAFGNRSPSSPASPSSPYEAPSSLSSAMASLSMGNGSSRTNGPPPPPLPGQRREQLSSPPPPQSYAAPQPLPQTGSNLMSQQFAPPSNSLHYPPPPLSTQTPLHQPYQSQTPYSVQQPLVAYGASGAGAGLPPPPAHFHSSFQGGASPPTSAPRGSSQYEWQTHESQPAQQGSATYPYAGPPPPSQGYSHQSQHQQDAFGGLPPPPIPQLQHQGLYNMLPPPPPPPAPGQGQRQYQTWQGPAF